jgi:exosortase
MLLGLCALERVPALVRRPVAATSRWWPNLWLFALGGALATTLLPAPVVALAADRDGGGLLGLLALPGWLVHPIGFLLLDGFLYGLHRFSHRNALLWRLHRVHHSDVQVDATTSFRHHPLEVLLGALAMTAWVVALGLPWESIALYALCAPIVAAWSHSNLRLPVRLESAIGRVLVTPGMHLLHHSAERAQTDSNYGMVLSAWDRLFGTFIDPAHQRARALGLEYFRDPHDRTLAAALFRQPRIARPAPSPGVLEETAQAHAGTVAPLDPAWRRALAELCIGLALLVAATWPTWTTLAQQWSRIEAYRHGWLVLPVLLYALAWHRRREVLAATPRAARSGIAVCAVGALGWGAAHLMDIELGRQLALLPMVLGVVLAALGTAFVRRWWPVLALLAFAIPIGDALQGPLRNLTAWGLATTLPAFGVEVVRDGYQLVADGRRYFVADTCSGLAHVTLLSFLGYAFGALLYRSFARIALLGLAGATLGVASNLLRVDAIVLIDRWRGSQMDVGSHGIAQWPTLALAICGLLWLIARLRPDAPAAPCTDPTPACTPRGHAARWAGGAALVVAGFTSLPTALRTSTPPAPAAAELPPVLGTWTRVGAPEPALPTGPEGPRAHAWRFERDGATLRIDALRATSRSHKLLPSATAPAGPGTWRDLARRAFEACDDARPATPRDCLEVLHTVWRSSERGAPLRHTYVVFAVGERVTTSQLALRAARGWAEMRGAPVQPTLVALTIDGEEPAATQVHALLSETVRALAAGARGG